MNAKQLRAKHKRERRERKRKMVENVIAFIIFVVIMTIGTDMMLDAWMNEINAHAEYNRSYIQELENNKRDRQCLSFLLLPYVKNLTKCLYMEDLTESAKCQKMVDMEEYGNCGKGRFWK